jgi:uncharacterized protein (TIGR03118 family)
MKLANSSKLYSFAVRSLLLAAVTAVSTTAQLQAAPAPGGYRVSNQISDTGDAPRQNANLINPIGLQIAGPRTWVAENGAGAVASFGELNQQIQIPSVFGETNLAKPTAVLSNPTLGSTDRGFFFTNNVFTTNSSNPTNIIVRQRIFRGPANLIVVTEEGTVVAYNPTVSRSAMVVVNNSGSGAVYKGATLAKNTDGDWRLYVANFHSSQIEVYDTAFQLVKVIDNPSFVPAGFAPFNVKEILGKVFVAYARQGNDAIIDEPGAGNGYITIVNQDGLTVRDFANNGTLNSPWGMAYAPRHFGKYSHALLVGNNGDGKINAFDIITGENLGPLTDNNGDAITIDGLWALEFNTEPRTGSFDYEAARLSFSAGPAGRTHGLIGTIRSNAPMSNR